ncbi:hypothetical protein F4777DRAFT_584050 [Nemania sp. FL0916]|nr:hypothetical protein F4777DRAFT_584050 [Nemania sp. FL0916]
MANNTTNKSTKSRLADSAYNSPYSHAGAPQPHPNGDPYVPLRRSALSTLQNMGYDPKTMVERGIIWAEDMDPFGHLGQAQYMHFFGNCFHRVMESYDEFLSPQEYDDMIHAKSVIPAVRKYEISIRRQVTYPDALIAAYRQEVTEPTRNGGTTSLFSLKQQTIVAECKGSVTFMDAKSGRPIDIRTAGPGWLALYDGLTKRCETSKIFREKWEAEHKAAKI